MPPALKDLTPYIDASGNWTWQSPGYYLHQGSVYLDGVIDSSIPWGGGAAVTQAILTGLPLETRPPFPAHVNLPILLNLTDDTCNPATQVPVLWAATIYPDGTMTLDDPVPDQVNTTPTISDWSYYDTTRPASVLLPQYSNPVFVTLVMGNTTWQVTSEPDVYDSFPVAPGADFVQVDGTASGHGSRMHMDGHYSTVTSGGETLQLVSELGLAAGGFTSTFSSTPAHDPPMCLRLDGTGNIALSQDIFVNIPGESPALSASSPRYNLNDIRGGGAGSTRIRDLDFPQSGFNYTTPFTPASNISGALLQMPTSGRGGISGSTIGGIDSGICPFPGAPLFHYCPYPTLTPGFLVSLMDLYNLCNPVPDWFYIDAGVIAAGGKPTEPGVCNASDDRFCGPDVPIDLGFTLTGSAGFTTDFGRSALTAVERGGSIIRPMYTSLSIEGRLYPPASLYTGNDFNSPDVMLWHKSQAGGEIEFEFAGQLGPYTGDVNNNPPIAVQTTYHLNITPFYELRGIGLAPGEILDLTGVGWAGSIEEPPPPPPPASTIAALASRGGVRPRHRIVGSAAADGVAVS